MWSVTVKLLNTTVWPVNELYLWEEFPWICSNEFSLGVEEFCIYWHCIRRQNRTVALSVVSLSALICAPFAGIYLHFSHVLVSLLWGVAVNVMYCSQKNLIFSSKTFIFVTSFKFKVVNYLKVGLSCSRKFLPN